MSMPSHRSAPMKKPLNPPPRAGHTEWQAPRDGQAKPADDAKPQAKPQAKQFKERKKR